MPAKNLSAIRRKLLYWYDKNHRDLPWRKTRDPYAIWIAETMLQQTQVTTVSPYFERFLGEFPTVRALHRAPLGKVLALWSGLGYYRRAENLKKSARRIVGDHGGRLPSNYEALLALPGVGDYTAGALMSIAFQKRYPAIDGNARRVLRRLFNLREDKELREVAARLVPMSRPGAFNQGLMELGATICLPNEPRCPRCPIAFDCAIRVTGQRPENSPVTKPVRALDVRWPLAIIRWNGKVLLRRRASNGMLAGLWELPGGEKNSYEGLRNSLARQLMGCRGAFQAGNFIGAFRHSITYRKIRSPVFLFDLSKPIKLRLPSRRWRWISPSSLSAFPVSSMSFKAIKLLVAYEKSRS
jgi:A/G-specific adenine glycosylase